MEIERIFSADQIQVHPDLPRILKEYTKAVIRGKPDDVIQFSWLYFKGKVEAAEEAHLTTLREESNSKKTVPS